MTSSTVEPIDRDQRIEVIKSTFIFVPGVGASTESILWEQGILTWDDWERRSFVASLSETKREVIEAYLNKADRALQRLDSSFFASLFPPSEYWRLYGAFPDKTLFLDIETTGLSPYYDHITVIGTYDGKRIRTFVKGTNLEDFIEYAQDYEIVVTFNGKMFDIPFIKKEFPEFQAPPIHIDLRYLLRSLGISGPLKKIEKQLSIARAEDVRDINGREAAILWSQFLKGDNEALERLLLYNTYDIMNLQSLLHYCYQKKVEEIESKINSISYYQLGLGETPRVGKLSYHLQPATLHIPRITSKSSNGSLDVYLDGNKWMNIHRDSIKRSEVKIKGLLQKIENPEPVAVGIDLSGSEKKASGFCILRRDHAYLDLLKTDKEIVEATVNAEPTIISIDSPLSLPEGRCCAEDSCQCRKYGIMRECERTLKKRGINVYPCLIPSMQKLTMRGIRLAEEFRRAGYDVIESYPGAAQDVLGFPRKKVGLRELEADLINMGIEPHSDKEVISHDEIDAMTSALVGYFYLAGDYEALGNDEENFLIIPRLDK